MTIILSDSECEKFTAWLLQESETNKILLEQMSKINVPKAMISKFSAETAACMIVAKILSSKEKESIGG
jgi:hypothetical protein